MRAKPNALLLMPAAALVVHQARYTLTYGTRANAELAAQGHAYLHSVVPWTIFALGIGASIFVRRVAVAARTGRSGSFTRLSASVVWALTTLALLAIYAIQETLEELSVSGHPGGMAADGIVAPMLGGVPPVCPNAETPPSRSEAATKIMMR